MRRAAEAGVISRLLQFAYRPPQCGIETAGLCRIQAKNGVDRQRPTSMNGEGPKIGFNSSSIRRLRSSIRSPRWLARLLQ